MWVIFLFERASGIDLGFLGINPRHFNTLPGILTSPLIHGDWSHLLNNSFSFLVLGLLFFNNYPKIAVLVFLLIYLLTGTLVWLTARSDTYHIGMSGVIYGMACFIFFSGFYRGNTAAIALSLLTALLYGSMVWGVLPYQPGISWESHLSGAAVGLFLAYLFRDIYSGVEEPDHTEQTDNSKKDFDNFLREKENANL
jgi:membrane associated rhomboid family serine protease